MILFKGSSQYLNPFQPQPVHPSDYHKFSGKIPKKVIFASESETEAKIFAIFSGIISFSISVTSEKPNMVITLKDKMEADTLGEKVYIYLFDSDQPGWKYLEDYKEWYNTNEQIPIEIREYKREEIYNELKNNPEILFQEELQDREETNIS